MLYKRILDFKFNVASLKVFKPQITNDIELGEAHKHITEYWALTYKYGQVTDQTS